MSDADYTELIPDYRQQVDARLKVEADYRAKFREPPLPFDPAKPFILLPVGTIYVSHLHGYPTQGGRIDMESWATILHPQSVIINSRRQWLAVGVCPCGMQFAAPAISARITEDGAITARDEAIRRVGLGGGGVRETNDEQAACQIHRIVPA
jgi:hypothetical protein